MAYSMKRMNSMRKSAEEGKSSGNRVVMIRNEDIIDNPLNEGLPLGDIDSLVESLKKTNGPLEPAVVWDIGGGRYMLVSGHRRRQAWCNILKNPTLNCTVRSYPDNPEERFILHAVSNTETREKDPYFWANEIRHARKLLEETGFSGQEADAKQEIYRLLGNGASPAQIARYEGFSKLCPELQALSRHGLSASTLYYAVKLNEAQQKKLATAVEEYYSSNEGQEMSRDDFIHLVHDEKATRKAEPGEKKPPLPWGARTARISDNLVKRLMSAKTEEEKAAAREIVSSMKAQLAAIEESLG